MKGMYKRRLNHYLTMPTRGMNEPERMNRRHIIETLNHLINCDKGHSKMSGKPLCGWMKGRGK